MVAALSGMIHSNPAETALSVWLSDSHSANRTRYAGAANIGGCPSGDSNAKGTDRTEV